jgi:parallel beta-helix repeat protein
MRKSHAGAVVLLLLPLFAPLACGGGGGGDEEAQPSRPDVWYVRASGSDGNSGDSPEAAWRSIQTAIDLVSDGDTIIVGPGSYPGIVEINRKAGLPDNQIFLVADPTGSFTGDAPRAVRIEVGQNDPAGFRLTQSTHIVIDGFTITGARGQNAAAVLVRSSSHNVTVRNCEITNSRDGIRVQDSDDVLLFNNLITGNTNRGVRIGATGAGAGSSRARLINNTIANNGGSGITIGDDMVASTGAFLRNNIVQGNQPRNIDVAGNAPSSLDGYSADFNLVFTAQPASQIQCIPGGDKSRCGYGPFAPRGTNDVNADAMFVNAARGDYHLQSGSPGIDAGTAAIGDDGLLQMLQEGTTTGSGTDRPPTDLGYHSLAR